MFSKLKSREMLLQLQSYGPHITQAYTHRYFGPIKTNSVQLWESSTAKAYGEEYLNIL